MTDTMFMMQCDTMCCRMQNPRVSDMAWMFGWKSACPEIKRC